MSPKLYMYSDIDSYCVYDPTECSDKIGYHNQKLFVTGKIMSFVRQKFVDLTTFDNFFLPKFLCRVSYQEHAIHPLVLGSPM